MEYSLVDIIGILIKRLVLIAVCTFIGFSSFYIINSYVKKPIYTASVLMYVSTNDSISSADLNELNYAQKVITTYVYFLRTKIFYEQVLEECKLNYTPDGLQAMTTIESISNTEIFRISVTSLNPKDSYYLVEAMQKIAPELIKDIKNTAELSVIDPVTLPLGPSGPNISLNTLVGGMLGFLISVLASFLWEIIDVNVRSKEELIKKYQIPVLGAIPNYSIYKHRKLKFLNIIPAFHKRYFKQNIVSGINKEKKFEVSEAYNELRTNLRFTIFKDDCKKIIISSPVPEDGKSTTSANIAIAIAQTGAKVLLMDCDLRKGRVHSFFNVKCKPGISDVLSGMISEKDVIQNTSYENLHVISMGSIPPNPTELLGSIQMEELTLRLEKNYNYIIIDSPPVNVVSDALSLVKMVDGIVIVVREGITSHPNIANALTKYKLSEANILGFVINGISLNQGNKSKSHYYYYRNKHD